MTFLYLALWLLTFEAMTLAVLPLVALALPGRLARAVSIARPMGFLAVGWIAWALPAAHVLPFTGITVALALGTMTLVGYAFSPGRVALLARFRKERKDVLVAIGVYLGTFALFAIFRALQAEIFWGEKPMDFTLLNYFVRLERFPVQDPWASGQLMRYYYLGTYLFAAVVKLTAIPTGVAYNLAMATIPALVTSAAYGAGLTVTRRVVPSAIAAMAIVLLGNVEGALFALRGYKLDFNSYWATSRVLKNTMANEYPLWSVLFADLHAHVINLAFTAALAALGLRFLAKEDLETSRASRFVHRALYALAWGACLASNTWDFLSYGLFGFVVLVLLRPRVTLARRFGEPVAIGLLAIAFAGPFLPTLVGGPPAAAGFERYGFDSVGEVARHLGQFLAPILFALLLLAYRAVRPRRRRAPRPARYLVVAWAAILPVALGFYPRAPGMAWGILTLSGALAGLGTLVAISPRARLGTRAIGLYAVTGGWLIAAAELFYLIDRMNTIFKIYCAVWTMLGFALLASSRVLHAWARIAARNFKRRSGWLVAGPPGLPPLPRVGAIVPALGVPIALALGAIGSWHAIRVMTTFHRVAGPRFTLDGTAYLRTADPSGKALFDWMQSHIAGLPTVLEAHGDSYGLYTRVAMNTGLPTVLGWEHHVKQRGTAAIEVDRRRNDVAAMYSGDDIDETLALLAKYGVRYVVVGQLERQRYGREALDKFQRQDLFREVYRSGTEALYEVVAQPGPSGN